MRLQDAISLRLSAAPVECWQDTAVFAADVAGCLETVSMELVPIVMVMVQGEETHGGQGLPDTSTSAVCVALIGAKLWYYKDNNGGNGDVLAMTVVMSL